jgi:hypothetical protein
LRIYPGWRISDVRGLTLEQFSTLLREGTKLYCRQNGIKYEEPLTGEAGAFAAGRLLGNAKNTKA